MLRLLFSITFLVIVFPFYYQPLMASEIDVPFPVGRNPNAAACFQTGKIYKLDPHGDGFLSVRSGPGGRRYREIDRVYNGQEVTVCGRSGPWLAIVYEQNVPRGGCGVDIPLKTERYYGGPCQYGWAHRNYIDLAQSIATPVQTIQSRSVTVDPSSTYSGIGAASDRSQQSPRMDRTFAFNFINCANPVLGVEFSVCSDPILQEQDDKIRDLFYSGLSENKEAKRLVDLYRSDLSVCNRDIKCVYNIESTLLSNLRSLLDYKTTKSNQQAQTTTNGESSLGSLSPTNDVIMSVPGLPDGRADSPAQDGDSQSVSREGSTSQSAFLTDNAMRIYNYFAELDTQDGRVLYLSIACLLLLSVLILIALWRQKKIKRMPYSVRPVELWRSSREQVEKRVTQWLTQGAFHIKDAYDISFENIALFSVPFMKVDCEWMARWSAQVGEIDEGSYNNAQNIFKSAMINYNSVPERDRRMLSRPREPRRDEFLHWSYGEGVVSGRNVWDCIFVGNISTHQVPTKFKKWCQSIGAEIGVDLNDKNMIIHSDSSIWAKDAINKPNVLPFVTRDALESIFSDINQYIASAIKRETPRYTKNVECDGVSPQNVNINESFREIPIYLVNYNVSGKSYSCIVDGVNGMLFQGEKASDVAGSLKRGFAAIGNAFGIKRKKHRSIAATVPRLEPPVIENSDL